MAGLCDDCLPLSYYYERLNLDRLEIKENRNTIASIAAGALVSRVSTHISVHFVTNILPILVQFSVAWWLIIDVLIRYPSNTDFHKALLTIGIVGSLAMIL